MLNIEKYLSDQRQIINKNIISYLPTYNKVPDKLHKAMVYSIKTGGKRLRPILTLETGKMLGAKEQLLLPVACAIEFIHTYSLIHDDLPAMDNDDFRRGKPTLHKKFGEAVAILAGDALLTHAFEIVSAEIKDATICQRIISEISSAVGAKGMVGGQVLDLDFSNNPKLANDKMHTKMLTMKTAMLIKSAVCCGSIIAKADNKYISHLNNYGLYLGLAFQLKDDALDSTYGKTDLLLARAMKLINLAKKELRIFGEKKNLLQSIADYVINRTY